MPRYENVADFVVRMDNLQYLANAELDQAALKTFTQKAVSFEVASELVTIVGENGTEVRLEEGSQDELAATGFARDARDRQPEGCQTAWESRAQVTNRNILILGALAIVVLIIGYYFLLLSPLLGRLDEQAQARDDKQAQLTQVQQEVNELEEVRSNSPEIQRQILELSKRIPAQPQIPTLVVQVQEVADASGVTQLSVDPEPAAPPRGRWRLPGGTGYNAVQGDLRRDAGFSVANA